MRLGAGSSADSGAGSPLRYQPALDGVRAVSVVLVLLFHGGVSWLAGGYLGVSVFFTLSGYLITTLLLREADTEGSVDVGRFYARRARRLLPASLLVIAAITVASRTGHFEGLAHLERDLLGALFQVANWVQLWGGESYADLLSGQAGLRSPLDHYWSLAIEEQFYWVWPLGMWLLSRRGPPARLRGLLGLAAASAVAAPLVAWVWGPDAAYWATPARASEILFGAALAGLLHAGRLSNAPAWLAPACLAAIVGLAAALPADGGLAYEGGLPVVALLSSGLVLGLQRPGVLRSGLSWAPVAALGRISYGVYLYHWPVFVVIDEGNVRGNDLSLLLVRLAITLALATGSYLLLERPIRTAAWRPSFTGVSAGVAVAAVGALVLAVTAPPPVTEFGPAASAAAAVAIEPVDRGEHPAELTLSPAAPSRPVRILVVGDSTAMALGAGTVAWATEHPELAQVTVAGSPGCGFVTQGAVDVYIDHAACAEWRNHLPQLLAELQPDAVVVMFGEVDLLARSFDGGPPVHADDPVYRPVVASAYGAFADVVERSTPAVIGWVRQPLPNTWGLGSGTPESSWAAFDEVLAGLVEDHPGRSAVLDLRSYLETTGRLETARSDGLHLSEEVAAGLSGDWLYPQLVDLIGDLQSEP